MAAATDIIAAASSTSTATTIVSIDVQSLTSILTYESLIMHLRSNLPSLTSSLYSPHRHIHSLPSTSSLLLMPCWSSSPRLPYIGVKTVTHFPQNAIFQLPSVHAIYILFSAITGSPLASIDGTVLIYFRTACTSALASSYLSRSDAASFTMIGAGALAPHLIKAHLGVRPGIEKVQIWNRTQKKAVDLAAMMQKEYKHVKFSSTDNLDEAVGSADIVSCATNSETAPVRGCVLKNGVHLDLVGSFKASMAECDDEAIQRGRIFVDNWGALEESGELVRALEKGVITREEVKGDLVELIEGKMVGRRCSEEITVFKSVGSATVDLLSAQLFYDTFMKKKSLQ